MEELVLTDPIVVPQKVTSKYNVTLFLMSNALAPPPGLPDGTTPVPGLVQVQVKDNLGGVQQFQYIGKTAQDMIKFFNTANFTTKSMHKRILERLSADGLLVGTVTGTPDPPAGTVFSDDSTDD